MQFLLTIVCLLAAGLALAFIKAMDFGAGLTIILVVPVVLFAVYSLARIPYKGPETAKQSRA